MYPHVNHDSKYLVASLLVMVAKGDGEISDRETERMLALVEEQFRLSSAETLALFSEALTDLTDSPSPSRELRELGRPLSSSHKEDIAVMMLEVIAADGRQKVDELERMNAAADMIGISPEVMHRAYCRYFDQHAA